MKKGLLLSVVLLAQSALANTPDNEQVVVIPKPKAIYEDSSEANRMNKVGILTAQLIGAGPTATATTGISAGLYIDRNSMILLEAMSSPSSEEKILGSSYETKASSVGIHYKQFVANSFYYRLGLDAKKYKYLYSYKSIIGTDYNVERGFEGESLAAGIAIGNQWQWENFTLGCDWVGWSFPITSKITSEKMSGKLYSYDYDRQEEDKKRYVTDSNAQALRFYLGASF